jgi:hypothetical protein
MLPIESFWGFITGIITYGGGASVIAYFVFQLLGKSWIESKFSKELEDFRHKKTVEIERLRIEVESLLSGRLKLQERDFELLPTAWSKLNNAHRSLTSVLASLQSYPNLDRYSEEELNEFVDNLEFSNATKSKIKSASKPLEVYREALSWTQFHEVKRAIADFKQFTDEQSILMSPDLKLKFDDVASKMWSAIIGKEVGHEAKDWKMQRDAGKELEKMIVPLVSEIQELIHQKLNSHSKPV